MIARAAAAIAQAGKAIRALIIAAHVVRADETPIRVGRARRPQAVPAGRLHPAADLPLPRRRGMETFRVFVFPDMDGVVGAHDCCQDVVVSGGRSGLLTRCVLAGFGLLRSQVGGNPVNRSVRAST